MNQFTPWPWPVDTPRARKARIGIFALVKAEGGA
jgi:hypothetical protein